MKKSEYAWLAGIIVLGALLRSYGLSDIPPGLHGDEAWTGIDALRIMREGSIPAYVGSAIGQPTGPLWLTAFLFRIFPFSVGTLRLSMALYGITTVPVFYILIRYFSSIRTSLLTTLIFATSFIHIFYSRVAFMLISSPLLEILSLIFLCRSERAKGLSHSLFIFLCGIMAGIGLHTYNAFILFPPLVGAYLTVKSTATFMQQKKSGAYMFDPFIFIAGFAIPASPLLYIMTVNPDFYFSHHRSYSMLNSEAFIAADSFFEKSLVLIHHGLSRIQDFFLGGHVDFVEAFGMYQPFSFLALCFAGLGFVSVFFYKPRWFKMFITFSLVATLATSALTIGGLYRRLINTLPFIFLLVGYGIEWMESYISRKKRLNIMLATMILGIIAFDTTRAVQKYVYEYPRSNPAIWVYNTALVKSVAYVRDYGAVHGHPYVLMYTDIAVCGYETFRFLYPDIVCEKRSSPDISLPEQATQYPSIIFMLEHAWTRLVPLLRTRYPSGTYIPVTHYGDTIAGLYIVCTNQQISCL